MKRTKCLVFILFLILFSCISLSGCAVQSDASINDTEDVADLSETAGNEAGIDYDKAYASLIAEWKSALNDYKSGNFAENSMLSFSFYDMGDSNSVKAYYALYDIDGNGTPELILRKTNSYEDIIAYIFSIKDGKAINIFGYDAIGDLREVPWSRDGASAILSNGLIDSMDGDYAIYRIADDGCSVTQVASKEPYDYPDEASLAEAEWRYRINGEQVKYGFYVQYLKELGYTIDGDNASAIIDWVNIK